MIHSLAAMLWILLLLPLLFPTTSGLNFQTPTTPTRRDVLQSAASTVIAPLVGTLATLVAPRAARAKPAQTILLTGATPGGIGFEAAKRFMASGHTVIMPARTYAKSTSAVDALSELNLPGNAVPAECDLSSLRSISTFVSSLKGTTLDTVCLNAGLAPSISQRLPSRTVDGFEETIGVNHFGHFALMEYGVRSLLKKGGRIVVTASGVHDPDSPGGKQGSLATLGDLGGLETRGRSCEMLDGGAYDPDKVRRSRFARQRAIDG